MRAEIITMDDWQALYVNGKLVLENHTLSARDILTACQIPFNQQYIDNREIREQLPEDFDDLKELIKKLRPNDHQRE